MVIGGKVQKHWTDLSLCGKGSQVRACSSTPTLRAPHYYGHFALSLGEESSYIFSELNPFNTSTPLIGTLIFYAPLSVLMNGVWLYIYFDGLKLDLPYQSLIKDPGLGNLAQFLNVGSLYRSVGTLTGHFALVT